MVLRPGQWYGGQKTMHAITSKLELNITKKDDPAFAANFAQKNRCPAIVTTPEYVAPLLAHRAAMHGQYLIITAIDFPDGKSFAMDKFRSLGSDFLSGDGFEILLTDKKTQIESKNEIQALYEFLRRMNNISEIRYVLGSYTRSRDQLINFLTGMAKYPPRWIRLDQHLELPNISIGHHCGMVEMVKNYMPTPLKISGNVNLETVKAFANKKVRFDVNMSQATKLLKEIELDEVEALVAAEK